MGDRRVVESWSRVSQLCALQIRYTKAGIRGDRGAKADTVYRFIQVYTD